MTSKSIFLPQKDTEWLGYTNLRNPNCFHRNAREFLEESYAKCLPYLDHPRQFKTSLQVDKKTFNQRVWELYLISSLLEAGHTLEKKNKKEGPDICLHIGSQKIWIEAICPDIGSNVLNAVPSIPWEKSNKPGIEKEASWGSEADREIRLRYTSSIAAKYQSIQKYIDKKIIAENDVVLIAINSANIEREHESKYEIPNAIKICYGLNNLETVIHHNPKTNSTTFKDEYNHQHSLAKNSGELTGKIDSCVFLKNLYPKLNGILYSYFNLEGHTKTRKKNFYLAYNNGFCPTNLPKGFLKIPTIEYWLEEIVRNKNSEVEQSKIKSKKFKFSSKNLTSRVHSI